MDNQPFARPFAILLAAAPAAALLTLVLVAGDACAPRAGEHAAATPAAPPSGIPEAAARSNLLAAALLGQQRAPEAETELRRAVAARPNDAVLLANLGIVLVAVGKTDEAPGIFQRALAASPGSLHAHYGLGLLLKQKGDFAGALPHLEAVVAADSEDINARYQLATVLARVERSADAEAAFRAVLERDPTHVSSLYGLGRLLLRAGKQEEGERLVVRSQELRTQSGMAETVGEKYGEQGPYAMAADYPGGAVRAPEKATVRFTVVEGEATGSAATVVPVVEGPATLVVAGTDGLRRLGPGAAATAVATTGPGAVLALAAGELTRGRTEVVALARHDDSDEARSNGGLELRRFPAGGDGAPLPAPLRFETGEPVATAALALVDRDHDGDLDVVACWSGAVTGGCRLATNDGNGELTLDASAAGLAGAGGIGPIAITVSDIDRDRDIDVVVASATGVIAYLNRRDGTFTPLPLAPGPATWAAIADIDHEGAPDLVYTGVSGTFVCPGRPGGKHGDCKQVAPGPGPALLLDADDDGFVDLLTGVQDGLVLLRNRGGGELVPVDAGLPRGVLEPVAAFDADGDGDIDVAARDGIPQSASYPPPSRGYRLLRNDSAGGHAIDVRLIGLRDNPRGVGSRVTVLAGALVQQFEATSPLPVHAGLGSRTADAVRVLWPGGVLQDELVETGAPSASPAASPAPTPASRTRTFAIKQLDRKGTSCPLLYAERGGSLHFVTDFLGGCAIGYLEAPGRLSIPDSDEYVRIEGGLEPRATDGKLHLRLGNQLEEVIWFDHAELVAVDHPAGTEVYANERLMPAPPFPEARFFASHDVLPVAAASDPATGADLTATVAASDRRFVEGFRLLPYKGYAELHALDLELPPIPPDARAVLLLDGWIDYADSSANVAAAQKGLELVPPRLLVPGPGGNGWRKVGEMGFPAGLPKTMAVPLDGALAAARGARKLRIETSMRIYWDRVRVLVGGETTPLQVQRLPAATATLGFGGFPRETSPDGRMPFLYDPEQVAPTAPWKAHAGHYTAYGDVRQLLAAIDDRFVVTRGGDAIDLAFDAPPPPAAGQTRTWFLFADGFGKDMDVSSAASDAVAPMPFHGMPLYPYAADVVTPAATAASVAGAARVLAPAFDGLQGSVPLALVTEARDRSRSPARR